MPPPKELKSSLEDTMLELWVQTALPSAEEKRIYRLPVFTVPFCQALLEELENFERSDLPKGRPNTMNNYGVGEPFLCLSFPSVVQHQGGLPGSYQKLHLLCPEEGGPPLASL